MDCTPPNGLDSLAAVVLEQYCRQRFGAEIREVNKVVRPLFFYCIAQTGMKQKFFCIRWKVAKATFYRYKKQGEHYAMKTKQGKKLYNEMMILLKTAIKKRRFVSIID